MRYETAQDANLRLHSTVIRYKGRPCLVHQVTGQMNFEAHFIDCLPSKEVRIIDPNDDDVDITTPPLGNIVWTHGRNKQVGYCERTTLRGTKQGLDYRNTITHCFELNRAGQESIPGWPGQSEGIDGYKSLADCILGRYADPKESLEDFRKSNSVKGIALDRKVALVKVKEVPAVSYLGKLVGLYVTNNNTVKLQSRFDVPTLTDHLKKFLNIEKVT